METTTPAAQTSPASQPTDEPGRSRREKLVPLVGYFLKLGTIGFGGPVALVGFGSGQPSRQDAVDLACRKAGDRAQGSVLASDGFFPFPDAVERAADAGVTAIIQPGGSSRDPELIRVANRHGTAIIFTGERHYRH